MHEWEEVRSNWTPTRWPVLRTWTLTLFNFTCSLFLYISINIEHSPRALLSPPFGQ